MLDAPKLKSEIEDVVRSTIKSGNVMNVVVTRDSEPDNDNVIHVRIVFNSTSKTIDPKETISTSREIRARLSKEGEAAFPVIYYIERSEAGDLAEAV